MSHVVEEISMNDWVGRCVMVIYFLTRECGFSVLPAIHQLPLTETSSGHKVNRAARRLSTPGPSQHMGLF